MTTVFLLIPRNGQRDNRCRADRVKLPDDIEQKRSAVNDGGAFVRMVVPILVSDFDRCCVE
jgi:hypothetical protein